MDLATGLAFLAFVIGVASGLVGLILLVVYLTNRHRDSYWPQAALFFAILAVGFSAFHLVDLFF